MFDNLSIKPKASGLLIKIGSFALGKERAGVVSDTSVWIITHKCWMYGPYQYLWPCIKDMLFEWKKDRHLVG